MQLHGRVRRDLLSWYSVSIFSYPVRKLNRDFKIDQNSTLPTTISSITVIGAKNTRRSFLARIFDPLLSVNRDQPYTQLELLQEVAVRADKLNRFGERSLRDARDLANVIGIYHEPISIFFDKPEKADPSTTPTDVAIFVTAKEKGRVTAKTGTDLGNAEGSAYANIKWRNVLGGAETLDINASLGTRTRSAYQAAFDTPILSEPDKRWHIGGVQSSTQKTFASHEEFVRGGWTALRWLTSTGTQHDLSYNGYWRQITGLAANASPTVRAEAGDSFKSSISHTWIADRRNHPLLPSSGYYMKIISELAGWGPLRGDVAFWKSEVQTQTALAIPVPGVDGDSGVSFTAGLRAGLLYPLALGSNQNPEPSHINDRFQLGGPTDVRGFRLSGLGPRDGRDAVGGDVYAAGSANILVPLPRVGRESPLRMQAFVNGGRLLALKQPQQEGEMSSDDVNRSMYSTVAELGTGLPSMSAGVGLVYAHPVARFELNFSLPLVLRQGEEGRKGLQFGIGIDYL